MSVQPVEQVLYLITSGIALNNYLKNDIIRVSISWIIIMLKDNKEATADITEEQITAGQAVYTKFFLSAIYDVWVLGVSNTFIWKCPTQTLVDMYNEHISDTHLDIGIGTGYFLDHCTFSAPPKRLALMDLNKNTLTHVRKRLERFDVSLHRQNILEPIVNMPGTFRSIAINYLFHCLPGNWSQKAIVFDHILPLLKSDGVIFGATLLTDDVERGAVAKKLMRFYNKKCIFSNQSDDLDGLKEQIEKRFNNYTIKTQGCAALFAATDPK